VRRAEPYLLTLVSGWEFAALTTGKLPTVTTLVRRLSRRSRRVLVGLIAVYLARHFNI
jgi:hypothetical protein